jgi:hypothetical protein
MCAACGVRSRTSTWPDREGPNAAASYGGEGGAQLLGQPAGPGQRAA